VIALFPRDYAVRSILNSSHRLVDGGSHHDRCTLPLSGPWRDCNARAAHWVSCRRRGHGLSAV
jgi:hypothetical protein